MNNKMFKRVMNQARIKTDFSNNSEIIPNTIKFLNINDNYYVYIIDSSSKKKLIIEAASENKAYKETLKYLGIKLDHHGSVISTKQKRG